MAGAALGVLNDKRAKQGGSTDRARIYSDAFNTEHVKCNELFKVVILNDTSKSWSEEDRINICFKYRDKMDENAIPPISEHEVEMMKEALDLFNEYDTVDYAYKAMFDQRILIESRQSGTDVNQLLRPEY